VAHLHSPAVQKEELAVSHFVPQVPQLLLSLWISAHTPGEQQASGPVQSQHLL
jgi:hypothetical protein